MDSRDEVRSDATISPGVKDAMEHFWKTSDALEDRPKDRPKIKYWWSNDKKLFCILIDSGRRSATVSLTPEEASLLSMNAVLD